MKQKPKKPKQDTSERRACLLCKALTFEKICPECNGKTTIRHRGYIAVINPELSQIANVLGIEKIGEFALMVRK